MNPLNSCSHCGRNTFAQIFDYSLDKHAFNFSIVNRIIKVTFALRHLQKLSCVHMKKGLRVFFPANDTLDVPISNSPYSSAFYTIFMHFYCHAPTVKRPMSMLADIY